MPYFIDSEIPSAVFLGLHLLVTDPSTSPRTPLGRVIFGVLYGIGVFALYALLGALGVPTFYDKLLCVPLLNLLVPAIDRAVRRASASGRWCALLGLDPPLGRRNLAHMAVWIVFFGVMTAAGRTDGMHRGDALPFWLAGLRRRPAAGVRAAAADRRHLLHRQRRLGLQRARPPLPRGPARAGRSGARAGLLRARLRGALPGRVREPARCAHAGARQPRAFDLRLLLREGGRT